MAKLRKQLGVLLRVGLIIRERLVKRRRKNDQGFTLVELLVVLAIFGFVTAIGVVQFRNSQAHQELDRAAGELAADIRWMQQLSANDATPRLSETTPLTYRYHLMLDSHEYVVRDNNTNKILKKRRFSDNQVAAAILKPDGENSIDLTFYAYDLDRLMDINNPDSPENAAYQVRLTHNITNAVRDVNVAGRIGRVWISQ